MQVGWNIQCYTQKSLWRCFVHRGGYKFTHLLKIPSITWKSTELASLAEEWEEESDVCFRCGRFRSEVTLSSSTSIKLESLAFTWFWFACQRFPSYCTWANLKFGNIPLAIGNKNILHQRRQFNQGKRFFVQEGDNLT